MNSAEEALFMGVDLGTQGVRVGIFDKVGNCLSMRSREYDTFYPSPGWAEQEPSQWWHALTACAREVTADVRERGRVVALTVCATSSTVLAVSKDGEPLGPAILWMDGRAQKEREIINATSHPILKYSGGQVSVEWMVPKLLWLKKYRPDVYKQADKVVEALDWLVYKLTGKWVASKCNAGCKWNYADNEGGWNEEFFRSIGLEDFREKWPQKVLAMGDVVGEAKSEVRRELGLDDDVLVVQGGIDAHTGMLGLGVTDPGRMAVIMGTSFVHLTLLKQPVYAPGLWGPYANVITPGNWLLEGGQISAGSITRWFRDNFGGNAALGQGNAYAQLAAEAAAMPAGAEGLIVLDFWQGNRTPFGDPLASGTIWGLRLHHTRGHVYRAILESVAYGTRNILKVFAEYGCPVQEIVACGGVVNNPVWLQIIADVCQIPVATTKFSEAGLLGAAMTAAVGSKLYSSFTHAAQEMVVTDKVIFPDPGKQTVYDDYFRMYLETYQALAPLMKQAGKGNSEAGTDGT